MKIAYFSAPFALLRVSYAYPGRHIATTAKQLEPGIGRFRNPKLNFVQSTDAFAAARSLLNLLP
jgi:hypothetical protein